LARNTCITERTMSNKSIFIETDNPFNIAECCICLDNYDPNDEIIQFSCKHMIHHKCNNNAIERCPYCRTHIQPNTISYTPHQLIDWSTWEDITPSHAGMTSYSFALTPDEYQPSGSANFSRVNELHLP